MKYAKGIMWLDDCRIPFVDEGWVRFYDDDSVKTNAYHGKNDSNRIGLVENTKGRFTPNLLVCDDMLNDGSVSEAKANHNYKWDNTESNSEIFTGRGKYTPRNDKGSNSRYYDLDLWFDKMLEGL